MNSKAKKLLLTNLPYLFIGLLGTKLGWAWRLAEGSDPSQKVLHLTASLSMAFQTLIPSFHPFDLCMGAILGAAIRIAVYIRGKNAKKYRKNVEYGSARWSA